MHEVRKATDADVPELTRVMARAFEDDPVMAWMFPGLKRLERFFEVYEFGTRLADSYTTEALDGAAVWAPPDKWKTTFSQMVRIAPAMLPVQGRRMVIGLRVQSAVDKRHPTEPHWYLAALGTDPSRQGKGVGSALLAPVLERCDREGVPAYLESSKERNVPYYRRHGFEVTEELELPGNGPKIWLMWRDPQPPS